MDFPLYFQNGIWPGGGAKFLNKKNIKKPNTPKYVSFGGNVGET